MTEYFDIAGGAGGLISLIVALYVTPLKEAIKELKAKNSALESAIKELSDEVYKDYAKKEDLKSDLNGIKGVNEQIMSILISRNAGK